MSIKKVFLFGLLVVIPSLVFTLTVTFAIMVSVPEEQNSLGLDVFYVLYSLVLCFPLIMGFGFKKDRLLSVIILFVNVVIISNEITADFAEILKISVIHVKQLLAGLTIVEVFSLLFYTDVLHKDNSFVETGS